MSSLLIHLSKDVDIDLEINDRTTVISGNSATGKSYIIDALDIIVKLNIQSALPNIVKPDKFVIVKNEDEALKVKEAVNKIIFIDRYDIFSEKTKKMIKKKMSEQNNTWIVMSRGVDIPTYGTIALRYLKERYENGKKILYLERYI